MVFQEVPSSGVAESLEIYLSTVNTFSASFVPHAQKAKVHVSVSQSRLADKDTDYDTDDSQASEQNTSMNEEVLEFMRRIAEPLQSAIDSINQVKHLRSTLQTCPDAQSSLLTANNLSRWHFKLVDSLTEDALNHLADRTKEPGYEFPAGCSRPFSPLSVRPVLKAWKMFQRELEGLKAEGSSTSGDLIDDNAHIRGNDMTSFGDSSEVNASTQKAELELEFALKRKRSGGSAEPEASFGNPSAMGWTSFRSEGGTLSSLSHVISADNTPPAFFSDQQQQILARQLEAALLLEIHSQKHRPLDPNVSLVDFAPFDTVAESAMMLSVPFSASGGHGSSAGSSVFDFDKELGNM
ncbi:hypothetical protein NliqN6_3911 [Naganishia liquefaciens]|uniref:Uncharacterized protein n=1 Tax=Naganishia liquefaciens TaxID=104408 RepID=A0A8H3TUW2_9TREE|nr:hypothetical protein NliqN6_3911 [Naganishia liquefaciens]